MMDVISHLHLSHLSINFDVLSREPTPSLIGAFSKVTHLDWLGQFNIQGPIAHFTSLTHLALSYYDMTDEILQILFGRFPKLEVVISLDVWTLHQGSVTVEKGFNPDMDDPRVVKMSCPFKSGVEDWMQDVRHGSGMWGLADDAVIERRRERERRRTGE
ncbi:hypothetical protein BDN72DRAFT_179861 [Pluteus cervinus]|uniref:Uncharacterized protein n=1 Tax=Pluteus cervinus TaxID=181527 RepID=A0ACD3AK89_9AGAR|nr:hypothetical protein BDN72DRAFT_179861 [Pluteus cervinus]